MRNMRLLSQNRGRLDLHPGAVSCCCPAESVPSGTISLSGNDENSSARRSMTFCSDLIWT